MTAVTVSLFFFHFKILLWFRRVVERIIGRGARKSKSQVQCTPEPEGLFEKTCVAAVTN